VALAQFFHGVRAVTEDAQLACQERLDVYMDQQVSLARPKGASKEAAQGEQPEPKPQISVLDCFRDVVVESRKTDPTTRILLQKQRIEGDHVTYDKLTGDFHVPGKGRVSLWNREDDPDSPVAGAPTAPSTATRRTVKPTGNPTAPTPARRATAVVGRNGSQIPPARAGAAAAAAAANGRGKAALPPLKLTLITFDTEMTGRYVAGKDTDTTETRWARFLGDVQTLNAKVSSENTQVDFDRPPDDYVFLTSQKMEVSSTPTPGKTTAARNYLMAVDEAQAKTRNETIKADVITYDSQKELFYAYAEEGRPVAVLRQESVGQPTSNALSQAIKYNRKTGESQWITPMSPIEFVQAKTGIRPGGAGEPKDKKIKTPRIGPSLRIPGQSQTERKGMTGR
jgi:lipopolysaccharide export system protein LptA